MASGLADQPRATIPPQVIPVNYLRWDVIYRGAEDDWGAQDVESPHVRIVAMHPVDRGGGTIILGELLNEERRARLCDRQGDAAGQGWLRHGYRRQF